jgi:hypothetical protein
MPFLAEGRKPSRRSLEHIVFDNNHFILQLIINYGSLRSWDYVVKVALKHCRFGILRQLIDSRALDIKAVMHTCIRENDELLFQYLRETYTPPTEALLVSAVKWNRPYIVSYLVQTGTRATKRAVLKAVQRKLTHLIDYFSHLHRISPKAYKKLQKLYDPCR